jgi:hypothetical protein
MEHSSDHTRARRRATARYDFYGHAAVLAAVMLFLLAIDLVTSPGTLWVHWPFMAWGLAVALHAARVFLMSDRASVIDAMTEQELSRSGSGPRRTGS